MEIKGLFPELKSISAAPMHRTDFNTKEYYKPTFLLEWKNPGDKSNQESSDKIEVFVKQRLQLQKVHIYNLDTN